MTSQITGLAHLFGEMRAHISAMGGSFPDLPFNLEPNKIPVKNGVLNFKFEENRGSVELLPHGPENYFTFVLNAEYKPEIGTDLAMALPKQVGYRTQDVQSGSSARPSIRPDADAGKLEKGLHPSRSATFRKDKLPEVSP